MHVSSYVCTLYALIVDVVLWLSSVVTQALLVMSDDLCVDVVAGELLSYPSRFPMCLQSSQQGWQRF